MKSRKTTNKFAPEGAGAPGLLCFAVNGDLVGRGEKIGHAADTLHNRLRQSAIPACVRARPRMSASRSRRGSG